MDGPLSLASPFVTTHKDKRRECIQSDWREVTMQSNDLRAQQLGLVEDVTNNAAPNLSATKGCTSRPAFERKKVVGGNWDVRAWVRRFLIIAGVWKMGDCALGWGRCRIVTSATQSQPR
jgi:hypothetical protein